MSKKQLSHEQAIAKAMAEAITVQMVKTFSRVAYQIAIEEVEKFRLEKMLSLMINPESSDENKAAAALAMSRIHMRRGNSPLALNALQGALTLCRTPKLRAIVRAKVAEIYALHNGNHMWMAREQITRALQELQWNGQADALSEWQIRRFGLELEMKKAGFGRFWRFICRLSLLPIGPVAGCYRPLPLT